MAKISTYFSGAYFSSKNRVTRVIAGTWCIGAFFLVSFYTSTLISYVTSPNQQLLVDSVYDLQNRSDVNVVIDRGLYLDNIFSVIISKKNQQIFLLFLLIYLYLFSDRNYVPVQTENTGILKYLGNSVNRDPFSRCSNPNKCLEEVGKGMSIYIQVMYIQMCVTFCNE